MTQEEKAKRYDEALEKAKEIINYYKERNRDEASIEDLEIIFPELKESYDERIRKWLMEMVEELRKANPTNADHNGMCSEALFWLDKQGNTDETINRDEFAQGVLRGAAINLITWIDYNSAEGNMCLSNMECKDIEDALVHADWNKIYAYLKKKLEKQGEQKPADKVEPKFHEGEWVVSPNGVYWHIDKIFNNRYEVTSNTGESSNWNLDTNIYHKFTIQDAKDGDVLAVEPIEGYSSSFVSIYKERGLDFFNSYCFIGFNGKFFKGEAGHSIDEVHPATKEQREQLEKAMANAGYTFDFEKKELKKIEPKPICELDNSFTCVKFPFKAKVKSSGTVVTIHGGQLSLDGKEWIKYQSDAEDRYMVYEPNNLELVCEIKQNPAWSEKDEKKVVAIYEAVEHYWSDDTQAIVEIQTWLKDRYTWKPSDEQMEVLLTEVTAWTKGCPKQIVLESLYNDLKKLREE